MTAKEAIERSISHNEIVTLTDLTGALTADLKDAAENWTRGNDRIEIWGTLDGAEWRVHVIV